MKSALPLALGALVACGGGEADTDGGRLGVNEEERVKTWLQEITPVISDVSEIDWFATPNPNSIGQIMRRLERTRPPMVSDNIADRSMREFHDALADRAKRVIDQIENPRQIGLLTDFQALMEEFEAAETAGHRVRNLAENLAREISRDFEDNPELQAQIQSMVNSATRLFSTGYTGQRTLPSMTTPGNRTAALQSTPAPPTTRPLRFIPPSPNAPPTNP